MTLQVVATQTLIILTNKYKLFEKFDGFDFERFFPKYSKNCRKLQTFFNYFFDRLHMETNFSKGSASTY